MRERVQVAGTAIALLTVVAMSPACAADAGNTVDLELVLAVDVSGSMDLNEQRVQREGYVAAFRHPDVLKAIASGAFGRIAVTYVEWASGFYQVIVVPWRVIGDQEDALAFASDLERAPISREGRTSISGALVFAAGAFDASGVVSDRRTIDVSGDGANNDGVPIAPVRDRIVKQGITINGLPILINPSPMIGGIGLDAYYHDCVIGGPGAFMLSVTDQNQFETAIRRKLVLEIADNRSSDAPAMLQPVQLDVRSGVDCLVGEKSRSLGLPP
jgi:Protein of unknown function (DUF1194)